MRLTPEQRAAATARLTQLGVLGAAAPPCPACGAAGTQRALRPAFFRVARYQPTGPITVAPDELGDMGETLPLLVVGCGACGALQLLNARALGFTPP